MDASYLAPCPGDSQGRPDPRFHKPQMPQLRWLKHGGRLNRDLPPPSPAHTPTPTPIGSSGLFACTVGPTATNSSLMLVHALTRISCPFSVMVSGYNFCALSVWSKCSVSNGELKYLPPVRNPNITLTLRALHSPQSNSELCPSVCRSALCKRDQPKAWLYSSRWPSDSHRLQWYQNTANLEQTNMQFWDAVRCGVGCGCIN